MSDDQAGTKWLVLVYQLRKNPGALRVKIWRRLQSLGAVAIKNTMYVLPLTEQSREDFQWTLAELTAGGGECAIFEARFVAGVSDSQVRGLFNAARQADYAELVEELRPYLSATSSDTESAEEIPEQAHRTLTRARRRLAEIETIDFFGADGHGAAEAALRNLNELITGSATDSSAGGAAMPHARLHDLQNRTWMTRRNVRVDRIASAWLIRRWIDPGARFRFVTGRSSAPAEREIRFDMFEGEFTHEGDLCTFEVLVRLVRPEDVALRSVAEIVHDIDLKDGKFGRAETQGVANLLAGIVSRFDDDHKRIERGGEMFDDLYRFFDESARDESP